MRVALLTTLIALPLAAQAPAPAIALTNANVIDGTGAPPLRGVTVVLADGRVSAIAAGAAIPAGAQTIDLRGRWVVPGLIDAHTHITSLAAAKRALESGVTTVRSASTGAFQDVALRELARRGVIAGPDVVAAGTFVTPEMGEAVLGDPRYAALAGGVNTPAELRQLVRINLDRGVDVIKTRGTERAGLPNTDPRKQTYTYEQLRAVVEEAATRNVPVMVHAHGDEGAYAAVRAGARSIEHGTYLSDSTLQLMKERGAFLVPTYATVIDLVEPGGDYDNPVLHVRGLHMLPQLERTVKKARAMGVRVVTGADTDYDAESITRVSHEVFHFVQMGFTPAEALRTATVNAAELLGLGGKTGTLRPGMEADLIVVEGNPLEDVRMLQDVTVVISNGRVGLNRLPFAKPAASIP